MKDMLSDEELLKVNGSSMIFVLNYAKKAIKSHMLAYFLVFLGIASVPLDTYILKHIIDKITNFNKDYHSIWVSLSYLIGVIFVGLVGWRLAGLYANPLFIRMSGYVRHDLLRYLMKHSGEYFSNSRPYALAYRASNAGTIFFNIENTMIWSIFPQSVNLFLSVILMAVVNPIMTGIIVIASSVVSFILAKMALASKSIHIKHAELESKVNSEMSDVMNNIMLVKSFGLVNKERGFLDKEIASEMNSRWTSIKNMEFLRLIHSAFTLCMTTGILVTIIYLWEIHKATLGDIVLVTSLGMVITNSTRDLTISFIDISQHFAKLSEALSILVIPYDDREKYVASIKNEHRKLMGNVSFENICFSYADSNQKVLENFNLNIKAGQKIGLVGLSGSGKSTLLTLLQRIRFPDSGSIMIDGININDLSEQEMRNNISIVSQDVQLLYRSIKENILLGKPDATEEELRSAIEKSKCAEFIDKLPDGINTLVGERGTKLSGGQRQRLSIARAFLKDTPILLLDEATSALDNESEKLIQEALMQLEESKTVIAVAHRISTLTDFDRIIVMDRGRIVQDGSMAELSSQDGFFQRRLSH